MIPKSDLYFTFCSTLNALSDIRDIKVTVNGQDYSIALGNGMDPSMPLNGFEITVQF